MSSSLETSPPPDSPSPNAETIYNANEIIDPSEGEGEGEGDVEILIQKWLDIDNPELTDKMANFLLQQGNLECLLDQITLLDPNVKLPGSYRPGTEMPFRARDYSDPAVIKRSYNAMEILSGNSRSLAPILYGHFKTIVVKLFEIFHYNSNGNFHHFRKLFESMLRFKPIEVLDIILTPRDDKPPLALSMLDFLDESPISASLGTILFFPLRLAVVEGERKRKLQHFLKNYNFIKTIVRRMSYSENSAFAASDFLFRIIDECTRVESSDVITSCMEFSSDSLVDWIFDVMYKKDCPNKNAQRTSCFKVLHALLTKSAPREFEIPVTTGNFYTNATQKTPNGIAEIHDLVRLKIVHNFPKISDCLIEDVTNLQGVKFGKYEVKTGFPSMRIGGLEIMFEAIKEIEDVGQVLERMPSTLWKAMVQWFFEYKYNNIYHAIFYKFVVTAIKSNHIPTLKILFTKTKLLGRLVQHYIEEPTSGCRGYILLICNVVRLTCDSQKPSDYIPTMLASHHTWLEFLPRLRADTLAQVEISMEDDPTFQRPLPHVGPLSIAQENDDMISFLARILKANDIDLGSQYAYSLGFVGNYPDEEDSFSDLGDEEAKKKKKNKKKREKKRMSALRAKQNGVSSPESLTHFELEEQLQQHEQPKPLVFPRYQPPPSYSN